MYLLFYVSVGNKKLLFKGVGTLGYISLAKIKFLWYNNNITRVKKKWVMGQGTDNYSQSSHQLITILYDPDANFFPQGHKFYSLYSIKKISGKITVMRWL